MLDSAETQTLQEVITSGLQETCDVIGQTLSDITLSKTQTHNLRNLFFFLPVATGMTWTCFGFTVLCDIYDES